MYERNPAAEAGMEAFQRLLIEHTGYPRRRGKLAELGRTSGIPQQMLGRYIRGDMRPTDGNLMKLAPALGLTFPELWRVLHPDPATGEDATPRPPDPNKVYRLSALLEEAQRIIGDLRAQQVQTTIASERRKQKNRTRSVSKQPKVDYDRQPAFGIGTYRVSFSNSQATPSQGLRQAVA